MPKFRFRVGRPSLLLPVALLVCLAGLAVCVLSINRSSQEAGVDFGPANTLKDPLSDGASSRAEGLPGFAPAKPRSAFDHGDRGLDSQQRPLVSESEWAQQEIPRQSGESAVAEAGRDDLLLLQPDTKNEADRVESKSLASSDGPPSTTGRAQATGMRGGVSGKAAVVVEAAQRTDGVAGVVGDANPDRAATDSVAAAEPSVPDLPEEQSPLPGPGSVVLDFIIGNSDPNANKRRIGWGLIENGWKKFVQVRVEPYLAVGVQRVILHNPFGTLPGEPMQLDQYLSALNSPGMWKLTRGFVEAWWPITERGIEVIAYVGCPRLDTDAQKIEEEQGRAEALAFSLSGLEPYLEAGMSIGLDAAAPAVGGSLTEDLAILLRDRGVKVYVEARPHATTPHWFDYPVICIDHYWWRSDPARHPDTKGAATEVLNGEILRMVVQYEIPETWTASEADYVVKASREIIAQGHTAIVLAGSKLPPPKVAELLNPLSTVAFD